jgi:hypothetical protein
MQEFVMVGLLLLFGLGAYWSMVIFPRQREFQKQQRYVSSLKTGDEMITFGGIIGRSGGGRQGIAQVGSPKVVCMVTASLIRRFCKTHNQKKKPWSA